MLTKGNTTICKKYVTRKNNPDSVLWGMQRHRAKLWGMESWHGDDEDDDDYDDDDGCFK